MNFMKKNAVGILTCLLIAVPAWGLGRKFPVVGGAVIAMLAGMAVTLCWKEKGAAQAGIRWTAKIPLQAAIILLGFGMDLTVVFETGRQSLPIIVCTVSTSILLAWMLQKLWKIPEKTAILVGIGSSICGGSAIAATAPVIEADDGEVAQSMSVIFLFNVLAAVLFPILGGALGFDTISGDAFGVFAGTAVNDTSSVTAAAATWDSMWNLQGETLDKAVMVKLTRTLIIIPVTLVLSVLHAKHSGENGKNTFQLKKVFPTFILFFVLAAVFTTICVRCGIDRKLFAPVKELSKFLIIMAMTAIGLNSNVIQLVKTGGKPILLGASCWAGITVVCLVMQYMLGIW